MKSSFEYRPRKGREVLFYYNEIFHIGYLMRHNNSKKPEKWLWYTYRYDREIKDIVEFWDDLPKID